VGSVLGQLHQVAVVVDVAEFLARHASVDDGPDDAAATMAELARRFSTGGSWGAPRRPDVTCRPRGAGPTSSPHEGAFGEARRGLRWLSR
jgi:hypothetical protein